MNNLPAGHEIDNDFLDILDGVDKAIERKGKDNPHWKGGVSEGKMISVRFNREVVERLNLLAGYHEDGTMSAVVRDAVRYYLTHMAAQESSDGDA